MKGTAKSSMVLPELVHQVGTFSESTDTVTQVKMQFDHSNNIFLYWGLSCSPLHHPFLGCQIHWTSQWTSWWASGLQLLPQGLPSTPWQVPKLGCPEKFWAKSAESHHCQMTSDDSAKTSWSCANAQELALATPTSAISHEWLHEVLPKVIHHQLEFKKRQLKITQ